jgi:hypothetical protein
MQGALINYVCGGGGSDRTPNTQADPAGRTQLPPEAQTSGPLRCPRRQHQRYVLSV